MYRQEGTLSHGEGKFTVSKLAASLGVLVVLAMVVPSPSALSIEKVQQLQQAAELPALQQSIGPR